MAKCEYVPLTDISGVSSIIAPSAPPVNEETPEERAHAQRRCVRCHAFFTHTDADKTCFYHPGEFIEPTSVLQGTMVLVVGVPRFPKFCR